jgi:hypothetical protein
MPTDRANAGPRGEQSLILWADSCQQLGNNAARHARERHKVRSLVFHPFDRHQPRGALIVMQVL